MPSRFGDYVANKRKKCDITLRGMAEELGITAPYLSDIEKGRRNPPNIDILEKMASILKLSEAEKNELFDSAGEERNEVSPDLPEYIMGRPEARTALRKARDMGKGDEFWKKVSETLDRDE